MRILVTPRWVAAALGLVVLVGVVGAGRATAHAVLLRSTPPTGQTLDRAPEQVQLLFSESIDPLFSRVRVFGPNGQSADLGDSRVDAGNDHLLVVSLQPGLPNAAYTVSWRSLSTIDIHPDEGTYRLFIGVPAVADATLTTYATQLTATPETTLGRWWFYLAASLFAGVLAAWKFVLGSALSDVQPSVRDAVRRRAHRLIVLGGGLLVLGTLYAAVAQAAAAADVPLSSAFGQPLADLLLRGRFASIWWPRIGLEVVSLFLIWWGGLEGVASESALATVPAVLLTSSLTSHGAALPSLTVAGIAIDWLHIVGATAWVGGLAGVLIALPLVLSAQQSTAQSILPRLLARFGRFALVASAVVVLSGTLQAALEVGSWSGVIDTAYGKLVLVKIGLLVAMLVLATFNEWRGRTSVSAEPGPAANASAGLVRLRGGVRAELALGVVVLAVAAVLSGTAPSPAVSGQVSVVSRGSS